MGDVTTDVRDVTTDVRDLPPLREGEIGSLSGRQERFIEKVRELRLVLTNEFKSAGW